MTAEGWASLGYTAFGGIMAMVGMVAYELLRGWRERKTPAPKRGGERGPKSPSWVGRSADRHTTR